MTGARAVRENGIKRVVNILSIGAGAGPDLGTISLVGIVESIFNQTTANLLHLRPRYFMENFPRASRVHSAYGRTLLPRSGFLIIFMPKTFKVPLLALTVIEVNSLPNR